MPDRETRDRDPLERALELLVFAPLGAGLYLKDVTPSFLEMAVARGRAEVDRRQSELQQHVTTARSMGQVAIAFGIPMVRQRVQTHVDDAVRRAQELMNHAEQAPAPAPVAEVVATPVPTTLPTTPRAPVYEPPPDAPASDDLPIPGYDALSASQVVERLVGLGRDELDAVHAYERAHRQRRTILGKIEQLAG